MALRSLPGNSPRNQPEPALAAFVKAEAAALVSVQAIYEVHRRGCRVLGMVVSPPDQAAYDDLFRRLEVRVQALTGEPEGRPPVRHLGRRFADGQEHPGFEVRREVADDRIVNRPVVLVFVIAASAVDACVDPGSLWVAYRVSYQRVAFPGRSRGAAAIEGEVVIAEGVLPAWDGV